MARSRGSGRGRPRRGRGGRGGGGFRRNPKSLLRGLIGQNLVGIQAHALRVGGGVDSEPLGVLLRFEDGAEISVMPSLDGETLRVSRKKQTPFPDDEPGAEVVFQDQTEEPQWQPYIGRRCEDVVEVRDMVSGGRGNWCGLELALEGGVVFSAYTWDEELRVHAPPEDIGFFERKSLKAAEEEEAAKDAKKAAEKADKYGAEKAPRMKIAEPGDDADAPPDTGEAEAVSAG